MVVIPACSVTQGPDLKTKLKIKKPRIKQDYKEPFLSELFLTQVSSCVSMLVYPSIYTGTIQGLCSRKEQARDKERAVDCTTRRRKYLSNVSHRILYVKNVILDYILLWAVSKHLVPQPGLTKLIFLKDDYCIQFKCSKYLIRVLICFLEPRTRAVTLKREWKSKLDNSNLSFIYLKVFRTALSSDFIAKVNI